MPGVEFQALDNELLLGRKCPSPGIAFLWKSRALLSEIWVLMELNCSGDAYALGIYLT